MTEKSARQTISLPGVIGILVFTPVAWVDDVDDVMAFIQRYADLENDLDAQAAMIRDDRVMIAGSARPTDQAQNMAIQIAQRDANAASAGGPTRLVVRVEAPEVRIYGDTAVASFMRLTNVFPANGGAINPGPLCVSLVLVKERGNWGIAHTHISPVVPPNQAPGRRPARAFVVASPAGRRWHREFAGATPRLIENCRYARNATGRRSFISFEA